MEQILHSIRDIIAEKTESGAPAAADEEVLELTEVVKPAPAAALVSAEMPVDGDVLSTIDAALGTDVASAPALTPAPVPAPAPAEPAFVEPVFEATPAPAPLTPAEPEILTPAPAASVSVGGRKEHLVSDDSAKQTTAALKDLMNNIPKPKVESVGLRTGSTVEDLVVESLKPMLTKWLDANLPLIVRELVQKEIEKLVPHETRD